ncbi:MAG: hypothetical protein H0X33_03135 [Taibaiella sp.]|nr:hypothetical protein [Taibaiella sp.]
MNTSLKEIEKIYKTYGFEIEHVGEEILCFLYKKGRYFGVDIIPLKDCENTREKIQSIHKDYSASGYAVNVKSFTKQDELEKELFKSFFSYDATIERLKRKYQEFTSKQTKSLLRNQYEYINTPYELYDKNEIQQQENLLESVTNVLRKKTPQLLIIEAAAGYGKTCSAYEILHKLIQQDVEVVCPLFTELSKNRSAKIFRYILLDEIDQEFSSLNSDLVIYEIKNGRIPLIIDGFDELLDKANASDIDVTKSFEEIETMLDTIGNLLERNAKIILTTRKTAIFSGAEFDKWYERWSTNFEVTRFSLKEPRIKDWLGNERFAIVKNQNLPIQNIANPVLLTYLKNISLIDFKTQLENPNLLVTQYFHSMLERERERQNLILTAEQQYQIFKNVTKMLLEFDITVESKEFFKEIIKEDNLKLLEATRALYTHNKPTIDNLVDTLATHALLDRKGREGTEIGFINDFVLGIFIGDILCESTTEKIENDYSFYMLDLACTAYKVQNLENKSSLWEKVNCVTHKLQPISIFNYDITLKGMLMRTYFDLTISNITYFNIIFDNHVIENSVFINCSFRNCTFNVIYLKGVSFISCVFENCRELNNMYLDSTSEIYVLNCTIRDCQILENYNYHKQEQPALFTDLEKEILKKIYTISATKSHHISKIVQSFAKNQSKMIYNSLDNLQKRDFIQVHGSHINFNINKLSTIKSQIGIYA